MQYFGFPAFIGYKQIKETMKYKIYHWYNALLSSLLTLLGYGCTSENGMDMYGAPVEYGVPSVNYVFKGQVTDEAGKPVEGIKTSLKRIYPGYYENTIDSTLTDAAGQYQVEFKGLIGDEDKLIVEDIDGETNGGEFLSDTISVVSFDQEQVEPGDGHWYGGKYEIKADVKLKKKP